MYLVALSSTLRKSLVKGLFKNVKKVKRKKSCGVMVRWEEQTRSDGVAGGVGSVNEEKTLAGVKTASACGVVGSVGAAAEAEILSEPEDTVGMKVALGNGFRTEMRNMGSMESWEWARL